MLQMKKEKCFCNIFHNLIIVSSGLQLEFPLRTKSYYKDCGYKKKLEKSFLFLKKVGLFNLKKNL